MPTTFTVEEDYQDTRLDRWFKNNVIDIPHSLIEKIIRLNKVKVNKKKTKSSYRMQINKIIKIYNKKKFKLNTFGQTAWTGSKAKTDRKIIEAMIKGNSLVALGKSRRGTKTKDVYSLDGFAKALNTIQTYCS